MSQAAGGEVPGPTEAHYDLILTRSFRCFTTLFTLTRYSDARRSSVSFFSFETQINNERPGGWKERHHTPRICVFVEQSDNSYRPWKSLFLPYPLAPKCPSVRGRRSKSGAQTSKLGADLFLDAQWLTTLPLHPPTCILFQGCPAHVM